MYRDLHIQLLTVQLIDFAQEIDVFQCESFILTPSTVKVSQETA